MNRKDGEKLSVRSLSVTKAQGDFGFTLLDRRPNKKGLKGKKAVNWQINERTILTLAISRIPEQWRLANGLGMY